MTSAAPPPALGDRGLFPHLKARAYLNHAAVSPLSVPVDAAIAQCRDQFHQGLDGMDAAMACSASAKSRFAELINARPEHIALVPNTTTGISNISLCFPWQPGDALVLFAGEFPANITPWQRAAEMYGLRIIWLDAERFQSSAGLTDLQRTLEWEAPRLVAVSAVQFQTGLRMPLVEISELCHAHRAQLAIDAIQACGIVPIDVVADNVDYLVAGSHKWMMGMFGCGAVYAAPHCWQQIRPTVAGWLSHTDPLAFLGGEPGLLTPNQPLVAGPALFEGGAPNPMGHAALDAALGLIQALGVESILDHVTAYLDALEPKLVDRGFVSRRSADPARQSGILSMFPPEVSIAQWVAALHERGVHTSSPDGHLRFAPHWPNSMREIDVIIDAVDDILHQVQE